MKMSPSLPLCAVFAILLSSPLLVSSADCTVDGSPTCHTLAFCADEVNDVCECYQGALDLGGTPGTSCSDTGFSVRYVLDTIVTANTADDVFTELCNTGAAGYFLRTVDPAFTEVSCLYAGATVAAQRDAATAALPWYESQATAGSFAGSVTAGPGVYSWSMPSPSNPIPIPATGLVIDAVSFRTSCGPSGCWVVTGKLTTGESLKDSSSFNTLFLPHAVADGDTPGDISYDTDYTAYGNNEGSAATGVEWTFEPASHPCQGADFDAGGGITQQVTTCCIMNRGVGYLGAAGEMDVPGAAAWVNSPAQRGGFLANYRPSQAFASWATSSLEYCEGADGEVIDRPGYNETEQGVVVDVDFPANPLGFLDGPFSGLTHSKVANMTELDPFFGQYGFEIHLDEVELRSFAGKLEGTIGVEHTVDTFIGLANFRTTGLVTLDTFATQAALHLEKTNFFSVSTHGVNEYTFLRYINLRLVEVLVQDEDWSGGVWDGSNDAEERNRTVRTSREDNVAYLQVTFTLAPKYGVNNFPNTDKYTSGLIPLDSVRVAHGRFAEEATFHQACQEYELLEDSPDGDNGTIGLGYVGRTIRKGTFDDMVKQPCGPVSRMCKSPSSIPDSFVSFNIPLGSEIFDETESNQLDSNIFVHMVINAIDEEARDAASNPNAGDAPWQAKTTLTANVPIVAGGVNIFCDAFVAKTDLLDVASADLLVGSTNGLTAGMRRELLDDVVIIEDIGHTELDPATVVDTEAQSAENGLMTLVLDGEPEFFDEALFEEELLQDELLNEEIIDESPLRRRQRSQRARRAGRRASNTMGYSIEVQDMFTIHLMEEGRAPPSYPGDFNPADTSIGATVARLMAEPPADNSDASGIQTEGYNLNGAFDMVVNRAEQRAELHPRDALLEICPFNPTRPDPNALVNEVCITRREIRTRVPVAMVGAEVTSIEVGRPPVDPALSDAAAVDAYLDGLDPATATESIYMASVLGDSTYARDLGINYAKAIAQEYRLNGRFRRAFWVNPAFEWSPTATGGTSRFHLSQRVYLFALVSLEENFDGRRGAKVAPTSPPRFKLLQTAPAQQNPLEEQSSGLSSISLNNKLVTPKQMMADSFGVSQDAVGIFDVQLQLTGDQACMAPADRQGAVRVLLDQYVAASASPIHSVQVLSLKVELNGHVCPTGRRHLRKLLADSALSPAVATVKMLVVFQEEAAEFDLNEFVDDNKAVASVEQDPSNAMSFTEPGKNSISVGEGADKGADEEEGSGSSLDTGLIAGICGGVGGALVILVVGAVFLKKRRALEREEVAHAVTAARTTSAELKEQLAADC